MTTIVIRKNSKKEYRSFTCMGHAEYAGKHWFHREPDILCASISTLVINTINALEELAGEKMSVVTREETGFIQCEFDGSMQEKSVFLLDTMVYGLQKLSESYGTKYLQVKFEEV